MAEISNNNSEEPRKGLNFVEQIVADDLAAGKTADGSTPVSRPSLTGTCT